MSPMREKQKKEQSSENKTELGTKVVMSILGNLGVTASVGCSRTTHSPRNISYQSKVDLSNFSFGGPTISNTAQKWPHMALYNRDTCPTRRRDTHVQASSNPISREAESFLLNVVNMSLIDRLSLAWKIIFPARDSRARSNANVAKQRLKMILFSDRCEVSEEAKRMIVSNIVKALSDFVEIESRDKVQLSVTADSGLGTVYSVIVPVRRVKPQYQDLDEPGTITNIEYKDHGEDSGSVDVRFDFYVPD